MELIAIKLSLQDKLYDFLIFLATRFNDVRKKISSCFTTTQVLDLDQLGEKVRETSSSNQQSIEKLDSLESKEVICGYSYLLKCSLSGTSDKSKKPWAFHTSPSHCTVSKLLNDWHYHGGDRLDEPDDSLHTYDRIDYSLKKWDDVKRINVEIMQMLSLLSGRGRLADTEMNRRIMIKHVNNITKISLIIKSMFKLTEDLPDLYSEDETIIEAMDETVKSFYALANRFADTNLVLTSKDYVGHVTKYYGNKVTFKDLNALTHVETFTGSDAAFFSILNIDGLFLTSKEYEVENNIDGMYDVCLKSFKVEIRSNYNDKTPCYVNSITFCQKQKNGCFVSQTPSGVIFWDSSTYSIDKLPVNVKNKKMLALTVMLKADGTCMIICGYDNGLIQIWNIDEMKLVKELKKEERRNRSLVESISFLKCLGDEFCISGGSLGSISFWCMRTYMETTQNKRFAHANSNNVTAFYDDEKPCIAIPTHEVVIGSIEIWNMEENRMHKSLAGFTNVKAITSFYSDDRPFLAVAVASEPYVNIIDVTIGANIATLEICNPNLLQIYSLRAFVQFSEEGKDRMSILAAILHPSNNSGTGKVLFFSEKALKKEVIVER